MSTTDVSSEALTRAPEPATIDIKLEVVKSPVPMSTWLLREIETRHPGREWED